MIWFRVTNNEQGAQLILDETAELYDFNISWNSMNADESKVIEKLDTVGKLMATYDRQGISRFDIYLRKVLEAIDPNLASQLIMPTQEATTKEIIETSNDIAKIASGQVVNAPEKGQIHNLGYKSWNRTLPEVKRYQLPMFRRDYNPMKTLRRDYRHMLVS